jgi:hypothetical protein
MSLTDSQIASFHDRLTAWFATTDAPNAIIEDYADAAGVPALDRGMRFSLPARMQLLCQRDGLASDVDEALRFMAVQAAAVSS